MSDYLLMIVFCLWWSVISLLFMTTQKMVICKKEGINDFSLFYSFYGWLSSAYQGV